jgi:hypothetical protein
MPQIDFDTPTKRELIESALDALGPANNESTRWAMRRAIVRMTRTARNDLREDGLTSRSELKDELKGIVSDIQKLLKRLRRPSVRKGLFLAVAGRELDGDRDALVQPLARHLEELPDALVRLPGDLSTLGIAAEGTIEQLRLRGQRGDVTPWHRQQQPAKVKFAATGDLLFQAARGLARKPDAKNGALAGFLALAWEAATGEMDVQDWTTAIRTARGKSASKTTIFAVLLARQEAIALLTMTEKWQASHRLRKNGAPSFQ